MAHTYSNPLTKYAKTCPDCNGKPFRYSKPENYLFIFQTRPLVCCQLCRGAGKIVPKKVIIATERIEPKSVTF